jgi:hypothetical protein
MNHERREKREQAKIRNKGCARRSENLTAGRNSKTHIGMRIRGKRRMCSYYLYHEIGGINSVNKNI